MKRQILIYALLISSLNLFSQEVLFEQDITLKSFIEDKRESLPIVNDTKNEMALFLLDSKDISCFLFNKEYERIGGYTTNKPESEFDVLLGHSVDSLGYHLIFTNTSKNQFFIKTINPVGKESEDKLLPLTLKDEKFLESISYKNKFYLITIKKKSSILKIYEFKSNSVSNIEEFDFSSYTFSTSSYSKLYDVLKDRGSGFQTTLKTHKIVNSISTPLDLTVKENKIYFYDNKIYITLDNDLDNTKLITIDLQNYSSRVKYYRQLDIDCRYSTFIKSNSYLFEWNLYQIKGCKEEMGFQIKDFKKDSLFKEFRVKKDEDITFKNNSLIQEGVTKLSTKNNPLIEGGEPHYSIKNTGLLQEGEIYLSTSHSERVLVKTKQVLKKMSNGEGNIGISVNHSQGNIEVTLGGVMTAGLTSVSGMSMNSLGGKISTPNGTTSIPATYHYNPTMYGYNTYAYTRSVYFKTLLDNQTFNHVAGNVSKNAYDKIREFEDANEKGMTSETIFKVEDYYVFGYYNKKDKKYFLRKFISN